MRYKFLEVSPVSADALTAAVEPWASAGWRVRRVDLFGLGGSTDAASGVPEGTINRRLTNSATTAARSVKLASKPGRKASRHDPPSSGATASELGRPSYALITLALPPLPVKHGPPAATRRGGKTGPRDRRHQVIELGELDLGDAPDISDL